MKEDMKYRIKAALYTVLIMLLIVSLVIFACHTGIRTILAMAPLWVVLYIIVDMIRYYYLPEHLRKSLRSPGCVERNDCENLYKGRLCWLTAHDHDRSLVVYPCSYPDHCRECKDYVQRRYSMKTNNKQDTRT